MPPAEHRQISRTEWHDWYVDGDESAVFVGDQVMALSPLATTILATVGEGEPTSVETVTAALVEQFGEPDGSAEEMAAEKVGELVDSGVLRWVD